MLNESSLQAELFQNTFLSNETWQNIELPITDSGKLTSWFQTTELAVASIQAAGIGLADVCSAANTTLVDRINVDSRLASLWFGMSIQAVGWQLPGAWDAVAGNYACSDGWIRLHTNAEHHRERAMSVLNCGENREAVADAVKKWHAAELEQAIVEAGGCAAEMRSCEHWQQHAQGKAVASEPLVQWKEHGTVSSKPVAFTTDRPLAGLRVLDLTRVLAGPVSTRFLAAFGADVLRIDPESWNEPGVVPEVTLGKRCAHLDLRNPTDHAHFLKLVESADVLVHGYRPGAMSGLGLDDKTLLQANPGLINISLSAYGWTGPWGERRGFDSLVQMSCGIADHGMQQAGATAPVPLPVQALDHATGYLMASAALHAVAERIRSGRVMSAKLSLARTAHLLMTYKELNPSETFAAKSSNDFAPAIEQTHWGAAQRVKFPMAFNSFEANYLLPATDLRSVAPNWL